MHNLKIRKEDGRWYYSFIAANGKSFQGSSIDLATALENLSNALDLVDIKSIVGERRDGRWHVKISCEGGVEDIILVDISKLPEVFK